LISDHSSWPCSRCSGGGNGISVRPRRPPYPFHPESDGVNLVRLENEHLGNIDQYRATRDIPLPYPFDSSAKDSDVEDWDQPYESKKRWVTSI
jgi:hypothetical protein